MYTITGLIPSRVHVEALFELDMEDNTILARKCRNIVDNALAEVHKNNPNVYGNHIAVEITDDKGNTLYVGSNDGKYTIGTSYFRVRVEDKATFYLLHIEYAEYIRRLKSSNKF
jgi:hypothetical protein